MAGRKRDVLSGRTLQEQRLDVSLGEYPAAPGDAVDPLPGGGERLKTLRRDFEEGRNLVYEGAGTARAAPVHPHVIGFRHAAHGILDKEHHLGILAAELDGRPDFGIELAHCRSVGYDFLDIRDSQSIRHRFGAAPADGDRHLRLPQPFQPLRISSLRKF